MLQEKETKELQAKLEQGERRIVGLTTRLNVTYPRLLFVLLSSCRMKGSKIRVLSNGVSFPL